MPVIQGSLSLAYRTCVGACGWWRHNVLLNRCAETPKAFNLWVHVSLSLTQRYVPASSYLQAYVKIVSSIILATADPFNFTLLQASHVLVMLSGSTFLSDVIFTLKGMTDDRKLLIILRVFNVFFSQIKTRCVHMKLQPWIFNIMPQLCWTMCLVSGVGSSPVCRWTVLHWRYSAQVKRQTYALFNRSLDWRRRHVSPKRRHLPTSLHGAKTQNKNNIILTTAKKSDLTSTITVLNTFCRFSFVDQNWIRTERILNRGQFGGKPVRKYRTNSDIKIWKWNEIFHNYENTTISTRRSWGS
jgi:hypothetical protein